MKKLHKYIINSFLGPWVATFFVCVFMLLMQFLWKYIDDLVGKGLEWYIIAELLFYASIALIPMAMPLSVLLATIMTFGNLSEKNELFAMKSGGVSLLRIMLPMFIVSIGISCATYYFSNNLLPYTNLKMRSLLWGIQQQRPEINIKSGIFTELTDGFSVKVDKMTKGDNNLENILIYDHRDGAYNSNVTVAKSGNIKITEDKTFIIFDIFDGYRYEESNTSRRDESNSFQKSKFKQQTVYVELDGLGLDRNNEELFKNNFEMISNYKIAKNIDSMKVKINNREFSVWNDIVSNSIFKQTPSYHFKIDNLDYENQKKEQEKESENTKINIIALKNTYPKIPFDSIYQNISQKNKDKVIKTALNYSRNIKSSLEYTKDNIHNDKRWIARHQIEWHRKYTLSLACLLFYLIGAPLGAIIRKGGFGVPVIISVVIFLFYYIISTILENTVRELVFTPAIGMWASTYILIPITFYLIIKTSKR